MFKRLRGKVAAWFEEQEALLAEKKRNQARDAKFSAAMAAREALGAAGRLEEAFERLRDGVIDLDNYRSEVLREQSDLKDSLDFLRQQRRHMDADDYQEERDRLEEDREEIRWRLEWVEKQSRDKVLRAQHPEIAGEGKWARFEYVDQQGEVTRREVTNWEVSGRYVRGYDRSRKAERNFRIDRISDWVAG